MSPRTFVTRAAAVFALAAIGLAACESKTIVQPSENPLQIVVTPAAVTLTAIGGTAQLAAVVSGGPAGTARTVTWASGNSAVVTVDATGKLTAVAQGATTVTATATADPNVKAAASVIVAPGGSQVVPAAVSISTITDNQGHTVDNIDVHDEINVLLNVDAGQGNAISAVNWLIDGQPFCTQNFTQGASAGASVEATQATVQMSCQLNTAALNATTFLPVYLNGQHTLSATLVSGTTIKATTSQVLVFHNVDQLRLTLVSPTIKTNPTTGVAWVGGSLTIKVTPAIFDTATHLNSISVDVGEDASKTVAVTSNAPQTLTFAQVADLDSPDGEQGVVDITASSVTSSAMTGPHQDSIIHINLDERGPTFSTTTFAFPSGATAPFWLNASSQITLKGLLGSSATESDNGGVNTDVVTIVGAPAADTSSFTTYTLAQAASGTRIIKITDCDAFNNCRSIYSPVFGADLAPPALVVTAPTNNTANPATGFSFVVGDTGTVGTTIVSGTPVLVLNTVVKIFTPTGNFCMTDSTGVTAAMPAAGCAGFSGSHLLAFSLPVTPEGYDSVYVSARDSAGNVTNAAAKLYLEDRTLPTLGGITFPATVTGGSSVTFSTAAADNVDLGAFTATESFGAGPALQIGSGTVSTFGLPMVTTASPSVTANPFIIAIYPDTVTTGTLVTAVGFNVNDIAAFVPAGVSNSFAVTPGMVVGFNAAFNFRDSLGISGWAMTATPAALCLTHPTTACPTTAALKATAIVKTGAAQPFASVVFYASTGGAFAQIGTAGPAFATENIINRTYDYSFSWTPAANGAYNVMAVALDAKGHALLSAPVAVGVTSP